MFKMKGILKNVTIPIYRIVINVALHEDCDKAIRLSKRLTEEFYDADDWAAMYGCYVYSKENNIHAIILAADAGVDTIAHECFHAVMNVLALKGIVYSEDSEECFAYVLGYLVKKVVNIKDKL